MVYMVGRMVQYVDWTMILECRPCLRCLLLEFVSGVFRGGSRGSFGFMSEGRKSSRPFQTMFILKTSPFYYFLLSVQFS